MTAEKVISISQDVFSSLTPTGSLVDKATLDNEEPTPGYLYHELTKFSFKSVNSCMKLEDNLLRKLKKPSSFVKLKTLRVIKHLLVKGNPSFRKDMQRRSEPIADCKHYRSAGEALDALIHSEAQECLNLLYIDASDAHHLPPSAYPDPSHAHYPDPYAQSAGGMGYGAPTPSYASSTPSYASSTSVYQSHSGGIGNYQPPPKGSGVKAFFSGVAESLESALTPSSQGSPYQSYGAESYRSPAYSGPPPSFGYPASQAPPAYSAGYTPDSRSPWAHIAPVEPPPRTAIPQQYLAAEAASQPAAAAPPPASPASSPAPPPASAASFSAPPPAAAPQSFSHLPSMAQPAGSSAAGQAERQLVEQLTTPSGVRSAPTRESLSAFCQRCHSLDLEEIIDLIEEKLEDAQWQVVLRALYVLEAVLEYDAIDRTPIEDAFADSPALLNLLQSNKTSVKAKARKILDRLGYESPEYAQSAAVPAASVPTPAAFPLPEAAPVVSTPTVHTVQSPTPTHTPISTPSPASDPPPTFTPPVQEVTPSPPPAAAVSQVVSTPPQSSTPVSVVAQPTPLFQGLQLNPTAVPQASPAPSQTSSPDPSAPAPASVAVVETPVTQPPTSTNLVELSSPQAPPANSSIIPLAELPVPAPMVADPNPIVGSLIDLDIPTQPVAVPESPAADEDPGIASLLKVSMPLQPLQPPKLASADLLLLPTDDAETAKRSLEAELMTVDFAQKASAEKEVREQHKKQQLETEHFQRIYASGIIPNPGAPTSAVPSPASPFMSTSAMPSMFVAQVPGPDGNMVPMMFTGLPIAMPTMFASASVLPVPTTTTTTPSPKPDPLHRNPDTLVTSEKGDTNPARFDFINSALAGAKQK